MRSKTLASSEAFADIRLADEWVSLRWNELQKLKPFKKGERPVVILSYPDDEGVQLNNGRAGAAEGPERIRYYLGRMVHRGPKTPKLLVVSDQIDSSSLAGRHEEAERRLLFLLKLNFRVITLGGGHDYGYPDASAFYQFSKAKILNVDAHLDVRPVIEERFNSGTPFFRFIKRFGGSPLIEWGIQDQCNALSHRAFAEARGAKILSDRAAMPKISGRVGLSICLDAFAGIRAVSAPCFAGLSTRQGLEVIQKYGAKSPWLGLYECAPKFDLLNEDSARFAALLAYHFIHGRMTK